MKNFPNGLGSGFGIFNTESKDHIFCLGGGFHIGTIEGRGYGPGVTNSFGNDIGNGYGDGENFGDGSGGAHTGGESYPYGLILFN